MKLQICEQKLSELDIGKKYLKQYSTIVHTLVLERWQTIPYKNKTKLWNVQNVRNTIMKDQKAQ